MKFDHHDRQELIEACNNVIELANSIKNTVDNELHGVKERTYHKALQSMQFFAAHLLDLDIRMEEDIISYSLKPIKSNAT